VALKNLPWKIKGLFGLFYEPYKKWVMAKSQALPKWSQKNGWIATRGGAALCYWGHPTPMKFCKSCRNVLFISYADPIE